MRRTVIMAASVLALTPAAGAEGDAEPSCYGICRFYGMREETIAPLDAGERMRSMTEARAKELEGIGQQ